MGTVTGRPDKKHVSSSDAERANLSIRMGVRRFTRLTNASSRKVENHFFALTIYFMHCNYVRIHQTLRVSPAMAAGASKTLWSMDDVVAMVEEWETAQAAVPWYPAGYSGRRWWQQRALTHFNGVESARL